MKNKRSVRTQNFNLTSVKRETLKVLFQMTQMSVVACCCQQMPLVLKKVTPQKKNWYIYRMKGNSYATSILHIISQGAAQLSIHLHLVQDI
jgi:hypothetical protein